MAEVKNLKHHATLDAFCEELKISKPLVSTMKKAGTIPADVFVKNGRRLYVHTAKAKAALKEAPIGNRGIVPAWAITLGNKAAIARAKAMAKAAA